jgi:hypothetical protein
LVSGKPVETVAGALSSGSPKKTPRAIASVFKMTTN